MKYMIDETTNELYAYAKDGSQDAYIKPNLVDITDAEAEAIRNPPLTPEQIQEQTNVEARAYLASTDWYIVRHGEAGTAVPQEVLDGRAEARLKIV